MKKIIIFDPYTLQGIAISKYLKKYGNVFIVGCMEKSPKIKLKYIDKLIVADFSHIDIAEYDYILPTGVYSTYKIINRCKKLEFENGLYFSSSNFIVFNKPQMIQIAGQVGVPIPETWTSINNINAFPVFYKENFERGKGKRGIAKNFDEIPNYNDLIFQEFINTPATYGIGFLAKNGEIITFTMHKEILSYPESGGSAVLLERFYNENLLKYTKLLLKKIRYNGWGLAEFKYCNKRNDFVFMEINGKLWASLEFMLANNHGFLKNLLNISYECKKIEKILFINRLFQYDFKNILKNMKFYHHSEIIKDNPLFYQIIRKIIPDSLVFIFKKERYAKNQDSGK